MLARGHRFKEPKMTKNDKDIATIAQEHEEIEQVSEPAVGQWYWVEPDKPQANEDDEEYEDADVDAKDESGAWLGCIVHIGSNYAKLKGVAGASSHYSVRIHLDRFYARCQLEPNAEIVLKQEAASRQLRVHELMAKVQEIIERLALAPEEQLPAANQHTQALATTVQDPNEHKAALVKAKDEDLPKLFNQINDANRELAAWMVAPTFPLQAQADGMRKVIKVIDQRIFHVELYAGLTEEVVQVKDGKPAHKREKLKLFQRRHYMDEECLIDYKAGGLEFESLKAFDRWLAKRKNLDRILPFPRCAVAFQVRRKEKDREFDGSLASFIKIRDKADLDKLTFLYIRNGEQVYRLNTSIDFGDKLFPDMDHARLVGKLWVCSSDRSKVIDQNRYDGMGEDYAKAMKKYEEQKAAYANAKKTLKKDDEYYADIERYKSHYSHSKVKLARRRARENLLQRNGFREPSSWPPQDERREYEPFDQDNVYYDDATEKWVEALAEHNRIALVLQGLFDRSPVLHPHAKVRLWTAEGFEEAIELVYDQDRALASANKPDFLAYWAKCNESLKTGSVTVGQEDIWLLHEGDKHKSRYWNDKYHPDRYSPSGNPGPGFVARVDKYQPRAKKCVYAWMRERLRLRGWPHYDDPDIKTTFTVEANKVFNLDAYKPGDFKQFYADPRTRAEYIQWAVFLLTAEDYHTGKVEVGKPTSGY